MKTIRPGIAAGVLLAIAALVAPTVAAGPQPHITNVKIDRPFRFAYPQNVLTITLNATHVQGVQKLYLMAKWSTYERGHNEFMAGDIELTPTGQPDQFSGSFTVPANDPNTHKPLPAAGYRVMATRIIDGQGANVYHPYMVIGYISFNPDPAVRVYVEPVGPAGPDAEGDVSVLIENSMQTAQQIDLEIRVYDHFQNVVASEDVKQLSLAPGKHERKLKCIAKDTKRLRAEARWRTGEDDWQTALKYANVDYIASGPRRLRRIEAGKWQMLVPETAPPTPPVYPPQGDWRDTTYRLRPEWTKTSNWTWFRQEVEPQGWLEGERVELRIAQADYTCQAYVNGQKVGEHFGSGTPFAFDVTKAWRFGESNVIELAVGGIRTTFRDFNSDEMYNCLTPAVSSTGNMAGIYEGVALVAHAAVYVDDVFVMPSVKNGALRVRTWLRNDGTEPVSVVLAHAVEDAGAPTLDLPGLSVTVAPGERKMVEQVQPWADPTLWWPNAPYLYRLRTRLAGAEAQPVDEVSTRFGFREMSLDGINVLFNGRIFRPYSGSMAGGAPASHKADRGGIEFWVDRKHFPPDAPQMLRTHQRMHPKWQMEMADEMGICIEAESQFNSVVVNATHDPRFWVNAKTHLREFVERDRNSPAVVLWSIANEVLHAAGATPVSTRDELAANMKKLAQSVKQIDPTRPVVEEGGADFDGTWEMMDLHYPRMWYNHPDYPNAAYWLKPGEMTAHEGGQAPIVRWNGDKPVSIGEGGDYFQTRPPFDTATYAGDSVYGEPCGYGHSTRCHEIDDMITAGYIEGYRQGGIWRVSFDLGGSGGPLTRASQLRVRTFIWPKDDHFLAGQTISRRISIFHDLLEPQRIRFSWQAKAFVPDIEHNLIDEQDLADGSVELDMEAGAIVHRPISFETPEVQRATKIKLTIQLVNADTGKRLFQQEQEIWVYPARPLQAPPNAAIGIFDPGGKTIATLSKLGVVEVKQLPALTASSLQGLDAVIVGEDVSGAPAAAVQALSDFVEAGGKVILLDWRRGVSWLPFSNLGPAQQSMAQTYCFGRAYDHPLLAGVDDQLLRLWSKDHVVARGPLAKADGIGSNFIPIIDAGRRRGQGLASVVLGELLRGKGSYIFCQLRLTELAEHHPGARTILQNLLNYAAALPYRKLRPAGVMLATESPLRKLLGDLKATVVDITDEESLANVATVIVDAHGVQGKAEQLRRFAQDGGIVLVKGLTAETQARFAGLFDTPLELIADNQTRRPTQSRRDPILAGISNEELYWERRKSRFKGGADGTMGTAVYDTLIKPVPGLLDLYRTEPVGYNSKPAESRGAGLVKIPVGAGWIVVDQTRWEAAYEPQPKGGWGGQVTFAIGLKRYVSYLLTNLGVEQR
jgi:hypothetical protein